MYSPNLGNFCLKEANSTIFLFVLATCSLLPVKTQVIVNGKNSEYSICGDFAFNLVN